MRKDNIVVILENAKFIYTQEQIETFIGWWNDGFSAGIIAERFGIAKWELALLVMHCELEGLITVRPGGFRGTIQKQYKKMGRPKKETLVIE